MAVMHLDRKEFDEFVMNQKKTIIVEYTAPWCVYCRRIAPIYERLSREYEEQLLFGAIDTDQEPQLTEQQLIEVLPTFVVYQDGKAVDSIVAPESKVVLEELILENIK